MSNPASERSSRLILTPKLKVRLFALQAAASAGAIALAPPVVSIAAGIGGLDPVAGTQRMMLSSLGIEPPVAQQRDTRSHVRHREALGRNPKATLVRLAAESFVAVAKKTRFASIASRYGVRAVPIIGCIFAAMCAYRSTAAIGFNVVGR